MSLWAAFSMLCFLLNVSAWLSLWDWSLLWRFGLSTVLAASGSLSARWAARQIRRHPTRYRSENTAQLALVINQALLLIAFFAFLFMFFLNVVL